MTKISLLTFARGIGIFGLFIAPIVCPQTPPPPPSPDISLSVNGRPEPQVTQGEPLIFTAVLFHPNVFENNVTALRINPQTGSWANTLRIVVADNKGVAVAWPAKLVSAPAGALTLDGQQTGILKWIVGASDSKNINPGTYQVLAVLDTTTSAGTTGWKGTTSSDGVLVQVSAPSTPTAAQTEQLLLSEAQANHLLGNDTAAVTVLNQLLTQNPNSVLGLEFKGLLLTNLGQTKAALDATEQALRALQIQEPNPTEPPSGLLSTLTSLRQMVYGNTGSQALATTTTASSASVTYNPASQTVHLLATVSATGKTVVGGTVAFSVTGVGSPATSPALTQGSASALFTVPAATHAGTYALRADYSGNVDFLPSSDTKRTFTVQKGKSLINWNNPPDITSGTPLGSAQLNATANVPGAFVYSPPANTVLSVGSGQLLTVNFVPSDSVDYTPTSASVRINVNLVVPGDLNGDGSVGCDDLAIVKASFGKKMGQTGFDPRADVNHDGVVNIVDLSTVAKLVPAGTVCK